MSDKQTLKSQIESLKNVLASPKTDGTTRKILESGLKKAEAKLEELEKAENMKSSPKKDEKVEEVKKETKSLAQTLKEKVAKSKEKIATTTPKATKKGGARSVAKAKEMAKQRRSTQKKQSLKDSDIESDANRFAINKTKRKSHGGRANQYGTKAENKGGTYYEKRENRFDVQNKRYAKLKKGGSLAEKYTFFGTSENGWYVKDKETNKFVRPMNKSVWDSKEDAIKDLKSKNFKYEDGGMMAKGGKTDDLMNVTEKNRYVLMTLGESGYGSLTDGKVYIKDEAEAKRKYYQNIIDKKNAMYLKKYGSNSNEVNVKIFTVEEILKRESLHESRNIIKRNFDNEKETLEKFSKKYKYANGGAINDFGGTTYSTEDLSGMFAKGGMTEHGLKQGDKITSQFDNVVVVENDGKTFIVNLNVGKRYSQNQWENMNHGNGKYSKMSDGGHMNQGTRFMSSDVKKKFEQGGINEVGGTSYSTEDLSGIFAKGGGVSDGVEMSRFHRNIMGTLSFDLKLGNMRKSQEFIVYPISKGDDSIMIQSDTRIGRITMSNGMGKMSQSHPNGAYGVHLSMDKLIPFQLDPSQILQLREELAKTAGKNVGSSIVKSDNEGASQFMMAHGGGVEEGNLDMLKNQVIQVEHHAKELMQTLKSNPQVDAWVVAKMDRATSNLSDITHYLEGEKKSFGNGGKLRNGKDRYQKGDEGMFEGDEVRVKKYLISSESYDIDVLDENGKATSHKVVKASKFEKQFAYFPKMGMGGKTTFDDKVKAISESNMKRKKVSPSVQKDYGKTYSKDEAIDSAKRIVGAMRKKEMAKKKN
jgi:predicted nucleic-acid-binding Zn-ribbon protein